MGPGSLKSSMAKTATVDSFRGTPQWKLTGVQLDGAAGFGLGLARVGTEWWVTSASYINARSRVDIVRPKQ